MPYDAPPDLASLTLAQIAARAAARRLPPVEQWQPERSGGSEMRIDARGRWYHQGEEIRRPAMVRAFASLLRRDVDGTWLVTPHEKLSIEVEDLPLLAVEVNSEGSGRDRRIAFRLNTDELVVAGPERPILFSEGADGTALPALGLHAGLQARIERATFYTLADWAIDEADERAGELGLWSDGVWFAFPTGEDAA